MEFCDKEMAIEELIRGREAVCQLASSIPHREEDALLLKVILSSLSTAVSALGGSKKVRSPHVASSPVPIAGRSSSQGRGCYKRRKCGRSWSMDSPERLVDDYAWRKYGQKNILSYENPRSYFRCTHKYDQHCKATKHEQKLNGNPSVYRTTYFGRHTCRNYRNVVPFEEDESASMILNFSSPSAVNDSSESSFLAGEQPFTAAEAECFRYPEAPLVSDDGSCLLPANNKYGDASSSSMTASEKLEEDEVSHMITSLGEDEVLISVDDFFNL